MFTPEKMKEVSETQLRVAFDGDAVLFSDESERIFKAHGLDKFFEHEKAHENKPLDHVQYTQSDNNSVIENAVHSVHSVKGQFWVATIWVLLPLTLISITIIICVFWEHGDISTTRNKLSVHLSCQQ